MLMFCRKYDRARLAVNNELSTAHAQQSASVLQTVVRLTVLAIVYQGVTVGSCLIQAGIPSAGRMLMSAQLQTLKVDQAVFPAPPQSPAEAATGVRACCSASASSCLPGATR